MPDTRVLVVDDERSMRELLAIMLKQAGHEVTVVDGGEQAIEAIKGEAFDLEWRERGGPAVSPPERTGFGSQLLQSGLASAFGQAAELEFATDGLICRMRGPLDGAGAHRAV